MRCPLRQFHQCFNQKIINILLKLLTCSQLCIIIWVYFIKKFPYAKAISDDMAYFITILEAESMRNQSGKVDYETRFKKALKKLLSQDYIVIPENSMFMVVHKHTNKVKPCNTQLEVENLAFAA